RLDAVEFANLHPLPETTSETDISGIWQQEAAKLLQVHNGRKGPNERPFIGVPCETAFSGGPLGTYNNPHGLAHFPLVEPQAVSTLTDADEWIVNQNDIQANISFSLAERNIGILRGRVAKAKGGSHRSVTFPNAARPWPLDSNIDPIPDRFLAELPPL